MAAQFKEYAVVGKIIPLGNGTRLRIAPSTFTQVLSSYAGGSQVTIDLVREFLETVDSEYVKAGDKWGRVTNINNVMISQPAWMAIVYRGGAICRPEYILATDTPPVPTETFPEYFILESPAGERKRYDRSAL